MRTKISIADNIRSIRKALDFSQEFVADQLKISQQAYSAIELDPEKASLERLREIARILQVDLVTLLGEDDVYIQHNFNQQGGNAATQMTIANSDREVYERYIADLKNQVTFLQSLIK